MVLISRSDFFSLMRKKSISSSSSSPESIHVTSSSEKFSGGDNIAYLVTHQSGVDMVVNNINGVDSSENGDVGPGESDSCSSNDYLNSGKNSSTCNSIFFSEEEEAAFLRSLGWEENTEEAGLTDEKINAFYRDVSHVSNKIIHAKLMWKIS